MSSRKWKIGDWVQVGEVRYLVYDVENMVHAVSESGMVIRFFPHWLDAIYLPDCDGWDWKPKPKLQIREGAYYALANNDIVGPVKYDHGMRWHCGADVWERDGTGCGTGCNNTSDIVREVPKPEPVYRPFASALEFAPHAQRLIKWGNGYACVRRFTENGVVLTAVFTYFELLQSASFADIVNGQFVYSQCGVEVAK